MHSEMKNKLMETMKKRPLSYLLKQKEDYIRSIVYRVAELELAFKEGRDNLILKGKMALVSDAIDWLEIYQDAIEDCEGRK